MEPSMKGQVREVYVISDLHIGGRYPAEGAPSSDRGFRMCTCVAHLVAFVRKLRKRITDGRDVELVINGDFVDFLAEEGPTGGDFLPFIDDVDEAVRRFTVIADRDALLLEELARFSTGGGRLTILLGNHDIELSFPRVRHALLERLGGESRRVHFVYDGEAYIIGDALIEHGNRYDGFNVVDHDRLRRLRSLQSRRQPLSREDYFTPPPGSRLVASIMNPIKKDYPFIDLLKPETEAVVPLLLALEPDYRREAVEVCRLFREANRHAPVEPGRPAYSGDISATKSTAGVAAEDLAAMGPALDEELKEAISTTLGPQETVRFIEGIEGLDARVQSEDIGSFGDRGYYGLARLLAAKSSTPIEKRLPALLEALRGARGNKAFDTAIETHPEYLDAARSLAENGFRYIIFGHTHLAKQVDLGNGCRYINTGTWADLIEFPSRILDSANPRALEQLHEFVIDLLVRRLESWITFRPSYAKLEVVGDRVTRGELRFYGQDPANELDGDEA
jgi:UDP-2,3-diacylglucosamine pyrophosphatase LpxH